MTNADPEERSFARRRHLGVALMATVAYAMAYLWLTEYGGTLRVLAMFGGESDWTLEAITLAVALPLVTVALPTWLVLVAYDTRSDITVWPTNSKWLTDGVTLPLTSTVFIWQFVYISLSLSDVQRAHRAEQMYGLMFDSNGLTWGWYLTRTSMSVLAEELLFSVLLQRGFEGYTTQRNAALARAVVFLLVHQYLYGYGFVPYHFVTGLLFGVVFMRTRSLMAPVLVHLLVSVSSAVLTVAGLGA